MEILRYGPIRPRGGRNIPWPIPVPGQSIFSDAASAAYPCVELRRSYSLLLKDLRYDCQAVRDR